jgi:hypothetical protein
LTEISFARTERLPRAMHDAELLRCINYNSFQFRSPLLTLSNALWHPACLCHVAGSKECFGGHMAKIIEFYIPQSFRKVSKWVPSAERGKVLAFSMAARKSA